VQTVTQAIAPTDRADDRDHSLWLEIDGDKPSQVVQQLLEHVVAAARQQLQQRSS